MQQSTNFNSNRDLQRALANLETFSQQIENEPLTQLSRFEVREGKIVALSETALSKIISLAYRIVLPSAADKSEKVLEEVVESSNVIRSYLPLFQMLEEGDGEQQKFVDHIKHAIARFNRVIDVVLAPPPTLTGRIAHFFYEDSRQLIGTRLKKINFPQKAILKIDFPQRLSLGASENYKISPTKNAPTSALQKIATVHDSIMLGSPLSKQTLELYAMKVISLLGQHASLTHAEAQVIVDKTAKQVTLDKQDQTLVVSQQLEPMPGQQFDIAVSFRADPLTSKFTIPVLAYQMSKRDMQTGFPHPLQHNGWALADLTVLPSFQNSATSHLEALHANKQILAAKLMPAGEMAEKARKLLRYKRAAFKEHKAEYLPLFETLALSMAKAASQGTLDFQRIAKTFFAAAVTSPYPYDFIADAHQLVLEGAIYRPQKGLQQFWLENALQGQCSIDLETIQQLFFSEFQKSLAELQLKKDKSACAKEKCILDYCLALSALLFKPLSQIALQPHAQIFNLPLPIFDPFTQKLQAAMYQQLAEFQKELQADLQPAEMAQRLKLLLKKDIALFQTGDLSNLSIEAHAAMSELNAYYRRAHQ